MIRDIALDGLTPESIYNMVDTGGVLARYPMVDQLHEPTSDGAADENLWMNCVFATYASIVKFKCRPAHQDVNGDFIKDHDPYYGQGYTGGSSAERIAPTIKSLYGLDTEVYHASGGWDLLSRLISAIDAGDPSLVTMPSMWNSQPSKAGYNPLYPNFPTHAGGAYGYNPVTKQLLVMNPWGGFAHIESYDYWVQRLCYGKVYPVSGGTQKMPLPTGWKDDGTTLTNPLTGWVVVKGYRQLILAAAAWDAMDVPIENEHTLAAGHPYELHNPDFGKGDLVRVQQTFHMSQLYARQRADGSWVTGKEWIGDEVLFLRQGYDAQSATIADLQKQLNTAKAAQTTSGALAKIEQDLKDAGKL